MKCIAIDDEPLALKQISAYIEKTSGLELIGSFESSVEALKFLEKNDTDLMFVDINMPNLNGIDLVKSLKKPPLVIFTTAYSEYAMEGFKVNAVDYLLKPIAYEDFRRAAMKAESWLKVRPIDNDEESSVRANTNFKGNGKFIFIKSEYKVMRINFDKVKYIESMREYIRFHMEDQKPIMTLLTIKAIENYLPPNQFMRIHRSFIVNLDKITIIDKQRVVFDGNTFLPISDQYKDKFQEYLDDNFAL